MQLVSHMLFETSAKPDVFFEGAGNILQFPEFQESEAMRSFAQLVDEKQILSQALLREIGDQGIHVGIGDENGPELRNFSVISTHYELHGRPMGVIGILGPKRMEYQRMMSIVSTVAGLVSLALEGNSGHLLADQQQRNEQDEQPKPY
jgi:heat-inducible transcriptional repressor